MSKKGRSNARKGKGRKGKKQKTAEIRQIPAAAAGEAVPGESAGVPPEAEETPVITETTEQPEEVQAAAAVTAEADGTEPVPQPQPGRSFKHPLAVLLGCLLFSSWMMMLISQLITIHRVGETVAWMWSHPEPVVLVCGVLTALGAILWAVFRRLWLAFLLPGLMVAAFSVLNYYKTVINNTPLLYSDLSYVSHFLPITKFAAPQIRLDGLMAAAFVIMLLTGILLYRIDRRIPVIRWSRIGLAAGGLLFFAFWPVMMFGINFFPNATAKFINFFVIIVI